MTSTGREGSTEPRESVTEAGADASDNATQAATAACGPEADKDSTSDGTRGKQTAAPVQPAEAPKGETADPNKQIAARLDQISAQLESDRQALRQRDDLISRLHQDLKDAREVIDGKPLMPIFGEIVRVIDALDDRRNQLDSSGAAAEDAASAIADFREMLVIALENCGLTQLSQLELEKIEGGQYAPREMKILDTVNIDDPKQDRQVESIVAPGYYYNGNLAFPTKVKVYRVKPNATETE